MSASDKYTDNLRNRQDARVQSQYLNGSRELKIVPAREHLFRESVARNMARPHFLRTDRKDKTIIIKKILYQHTLLNIPNKGGLNCASDGVYIHIGGTDILMGLCFCAFIDV